MNSTSPEKCHHYRQYRNVQNNLNVHGSFPLLPLRSYSRSFLQLLLVRSCSFTWIHTFLRINNIPCLSSQNVACRYPSTLCTNPTNFKAKYIYLSFFVYVYLNSWNFNLRKSHSISINYFSFNSAPPLLFFIFHKKIFLHFKFGKNMNFPIPIQRMLCFMSRKKCWKSWLSCYYTVNSFLLTHPFLVKFFQEISLLQRCLISLGCYDKCATYCQSLFPQGGVGNISNQ